MVHTNLTQKKVECKFCDKQVWMQHWFTDNNQGNKTMHSNDSISALALFHNKKCFSDFLICAIIQKALIYCSVCRLLLNVTAILFPLHNHPICVTSML